MNETQVLIVGAGPTGLVLALFLVKAGSRRASLTRTPARARPPARWPCRPARWSSTASSGSPTKWWSRASPSSPFTCGRTAMSSAEVSIADFGEGLSPYPFVLSFPQDDHERLLVERLRAAGVEVEWDTEMTGHARHGRGGPRDPARKPDGTEEDCAAAYLCGCDGARSTVRQDLRLGFAGGTYDKTYFVADVEATGEAAEGQTFSLCLGANDLLLVLPVRSTGMNRLIGVIPEELKGREDVTFEDIRPFAEEAADIRVRNVNWFSTYKAHHRVADHFRAGRVFVSGDAGHIHSPVGGQGMNTGIGDAVNLAWKLAAVVQGRADVSLLDTYEPERIAFARSLVATTDKMFQLMTGLGRGPAAVPRNADAAPRAVRAGLLGRAHRRLPPGVADAHRTTTGARSARARRASVHGGDRLPWVPSERRGRQLRAARNRWTGRSTSTAMAGPGAAGGGADGGPGPASVRLVGAGGESRAEARRALPGPARRLRRPGRRWAGCVNAPGVPRLRFKLISRQSAAA